MLNSGEDHPLNGSVHVGCRDDLAELTRLYRCAYPHATEANLATDIKPHEVNSWITYQNQEGEVLIAMHVRMDGLVWLIANPAHCDSLSMVNGFLALVEEARRSLAVYGVRGFEVLHAPSLEPLARRLEEQGLIGTKLAVIRSYRFDANNPKPIKIKAN